jgi:thiol-disulfide isomerase/thioredoxin
MKCIKNRSWIIFLLLFLASYSHANGAVAQPLDFEADTISGQHLKLSNFKGKIVLLDFWATWCPPCRVEVPNLINIFRQFRNKDCVLISVSLDRDLQVARQFVKEKEMNWLHIIDRESSNNIALLYEIEYIPATFIIDGKGNILARNLRGAELKNTIANLLK